MKFNQVELQRQGVADDGESDDHKPQDVTAVLLRVATVLLRHVRLASWCRRPAMACYCVIEIRRVVQE